ncbi:TPA: hypothetical protein ACGOYX_001098 [Streptococcus suis]
MEIVYKHPGFTPLQADKKMIDQIDRKVIRLEYPDGVIAQFIIEENVSITVQSNRSFILDHENGETVVRPNLYEIDPSFVDIFDQ